MKDSKEKENRISNLKNMFDHIIILAKILPKQLI